MTRSTVILTGHLAVGVANRTAADVVMPLRVLHLTNQHGRVFSRAALQSRQKTLPKKNSSWKCSEYNFKHSNL